MDERIELNRKMLMFYRKLIEHGIEMEKESGEQEYGYILYVRDVEEEQEEEQPFFYRGEKFVYNMGLKRMILKSSLPVSSIYLPMYILRELISNPVIHTENHPILEKYHEYLQKNNLEDGVDIFHRMMSQSGDYWYQKTGKSKYPPESTFIYDFIETLIDQYIYQDGKYIKHLKRWVDDKWINITMELFEEVTFDYQRIFKYVRDSSKFGIDKPSIVEYTLQDMLEYINKLLYISECHDDRSLLISALILESKKPEKIEEYLSKGYSIEEVLTYVGYH